MRIQEQSILVKNSIGIDRLRGRDKPVSQPPTLFTIVYTVYEPSMLRDCSELNALHMLAPCLSKGRKFAALIQFTFRAELKGH
jgi:hypothetical protein